MKIARMENPPAVAELLRRFGARPLPFALDSARTDYGLGGWSFFGASPFAVVSGKEGQWRREPGPGRDGAGNGAEGDGLAFLRESLRPYGGADLSIPAGAGTIPPFVGGAVGFLAYDFGRSIERVPVLAADDRGLPDLWFGLYDGIAALEHRTGVLHLVALGIRADADAVLEELRDMVSAPVAPGPPPRRSGDWTWNLSEEGYRVAAARVREYIAAGDVYQVNLSRRARCGIEGDPLRLYEALRRGNAAPYGAYVDAGDWRILSTSPEQFLRKRGRAVETRPIKGTCPRGATPEADRANAEGLRASAKDRAELLMIVDLERNDLGRVAEFGSVSVSDLYALEHYARVIHQTARVRARLAEGADVFDCVRALFPGGSVTGAPKIRAMEIIEELEPTRRGVYCGSIGWIGFGGDAEFNIAIRTLHCGRGVLDYQVGGGIVWDSDPEAELRETEDKGVAMRETVDGLGRD